MKVVIPMAGKGKRFDKYLAQKPLIKIDGKPMIEHVVDYFPRHSEFIFICHENQLKTTNIKKVLKKIDPNCKIVLVSDKHLKGPAYTTIAAFNLIGDEEEVIVNYCDFIQEWNYGAFIKTVRRIKPEGAITTFKGFHPASLGKTYYAYMKVKDNFVQEIREKESFSEDRTKDFASTGTYYFSSGKILKRYIKKLVSDEENAVDGEFYMSLPYNLMIKDGLKVLNFEVEKFICLGTPRDYELYKFWSEFFLKNSPNPITFDNVNINVTNIFPLAGGERDFKEIGFDDLNFMLPIMNKPLIYYSFKSNPNGVRNIFIGLKENKDVFESCPIFNDCRSEVILLDEKKNSLAETIYSIKDYINPEDPICVLGGTYILDYNERKIINLMEKEDIDIILFSFSHNEAVLRNPGGFAYAKIKNNIEVKEIVEKLTISENPYHDNALTGTSIFKKAKYLFDSLKEEIDKSKGKRLYYLNCLNSIIDKKKAVIFEVDKFVPLRTPVNYKEFVYWQDYFDKLSYHPYSKMFQ